MEKTMQTTDVMLHFNTPLSHDQEHEIEDRMREVDGVTAPRFNMPQTLMVLYDSDKTNSVNLLHTVNSWGYEAHLIGL